jgi:hypothetical protein
MSKQQEAISVPTTAEDIFALGAIILQIWSGVSPSKMTGEPIIELAKKVAFFIPDKRIADLVTQCLWPEDNQRPNATEILQELKQYKTDLKNKVHRQNNQIVPYTREQIMATVQAGIQTLTTPLMVDEDKGWFSDDMKPPPAEEKNKLRKTWYASYSHGASGIIYMLTQAKRAGLDISMTLPFIDKGLYVIKRRYINHIEEKAAGYNFGSDGIAAVLSCAIYEGVIEPTSEYLEWINILLQKTAKGDSISHGIAGQGFCNLISRSFVSPENLVERLGNYANRLITKQDVDGKWVNGHYTQKFTKRKIKKASKGLMDGMSGIICFLLEFGHRYKHTESILAAERGLKWLIKNAKRKKGGIHWRTSKDKNLNYDMASGISGIALCFIKAYQYTNNPLYKKTATAALKPIQENITDSNISQRYGLAGLGEVYLEAFQIFKEEIWLQRASWLAQLIMQLKKQHPEHGVYWLVEHERQPVANFMIGNSGILHFLLRFCNQKQIRFPLLPE